MNKPYFYLHALLLVAIFALTPSCNAQKKPSTKKENKPLEYGARNIVTDAVLDKDGNMWFTTLTEGVFKYDGETFTNFTEKEGLNSNKVSSVIESKDGILWFGTDDGLCSYDGKTFLHIPLPDKGRSHPGDDLKNPRTNTNTVLSLLQDKKGAIWIGTLGNGTYHYDGEKFTHYLSNKGRKQQDSLYFNVIQSIVEGEDGDIWFTSQTHGGLSRFDGEDFTYYSKKDGLPDDMIFSSFKDDEEGLWFGTLDGGLISYKEETFHYFDENDGLCNNMISCFYQDKTGKLWIGSFRGSSVCLYDGKNFMPFSKDENQNLVELRFITEDKEGNIWFGGRYGILWRYDGENLTDFTQKGR